MSASPSHPRISKEPILFRPRTLNLNPSPTVAGNTELDALFDMPGNTTPRPQGVAAKAQNPFASIYPGPNPFNQESTTPETPTQEELPDWILSRPPRLSMAFVAIGLLCLACAGFGISQVISPLMNGEAINMANHSDMRWGTGGGNSTDDGLEAFSFPVVDTKMQVTNPDGTSNTLPIGTSMKVLKQARQGKKQLALQYGRQDPFSPLVTPEDPNAAQTPEPIVVEPPFTYVGIIKDTLNTKNPRHVAMLQLTNDEKGRTLIKEAGDTFDVNGAKFRITGVYADRVTLVMDGENRILPIKTFSDVAAEVKAKSQTDQNNMLGGSR